MRRLCGDNVSKKNLSARIKTGENRDIIYSVKKYTIYRKYILSEKRKKWRLYTLQFCSYLYSWVDCFIQLLHNRNTNQLEIRNSYSRHFFFRWETRTRVDLSSWTFRSPIPNIPRSTNVLYKKEKQKNEFYGSLDPRIRAFSAISYPTRIRQPHYRSESWILGGRESSDARGEILRFINHKICGTVILIYLSFGESSVSRSWHSRDGIL